MGPLMKAARFQPQVQLVDPDEEEKEDDENWEFVNIGGGQSFGIATAGLEEKATACSMLVCYAKELGGKFGNYDVRCMCTGGFFRAFQSICEN